MEQPEAGNKYRRILRAGDTLQILQNCDPTTDTKGGGTWVNAIVVSNSEMAVTVKFPDGVQEVIPWASGRVRGSGS